MKNESLVQALKVIRNKFAHSGHDLDAESLATEVRGLGITIPPGDLQAFVADVIRTLGGNRYGEYFVPQVVLDAARCLLEGQSGGTALDPSAGLGVLAATVHLQARHTIAYQRRHGIQSLGQVLAPMLDWRAGRLTDPIAHLSDHVVPPAPFDVVASILPFGSRLPFTAEVHGGSGFSLKTRDEASLVIAETSLRLAPNGIGLFVVPPSFFLSASSIVPQLPHLGLGLEAALELPAGSFLPYTNIAAFLVVVRRRTAAKMFVAQLSQDLSTTKQIVSNLRAGNVDGALELGRFVAPEEFRGLGPLRMEEQLAQEAARWNSPARKLESLATTIQLGKPGADFEFPAAGNAVFIPLIGNADVVDSPEGMTLKKQNYAQAVIDPSLSHAGFVARFLNTELGRAIREANKAGAVILKLNTSGLKNLAVIVPELETQTKTLEVDVQLGIQQNTLLSLQNDLSSLRRELWTNAGDLDELRSRVTKFSSRLAIESIPNAPATLEQWFETLPFPLASILRAWQATPSDNYKTKYEHLLHFFEAATEFFGLIFLSAYSSQPEFFDEHRTKLNDIWTKQKLSLRRATFGTWKVVVEYLGKQTRALLLSDDPQKRKLCAELFADHDLTLPAMLSRQELPSLFSAAIKLRNDVAHGGSIGGTEAQRINNDLLSLVQQLREAMADGWAKSLLVRSLHCRPRGGAFETEITMMVGSNSEFVAESRRMSSFLDVDRLYLLSGGSTRGLILLPLMQVGPSPSSAKNACYFFNRVDREVFRFVSYHFIDQPEFKTESNDMAEAINLLTEAQAD